MKYFLVKFNDNYADEFDLEGFWLEKAESKEEVIILISNGFESERGNKYPVECYFGTNEYLQYNNIEDYLSVLNISEITKEEYDVLQKLFGGSFGQVI